jgi:predicted O-methyltransferase YrrM
MSSVDEVRRYYDLNTPRWLGRPRATGTIHRAVWGEGVNTERDAFEYIDRLILGELRGLEAALATPLHLLDLGCGVGASLIYLASHAAIKGTGVTVSGVQAGMARERVAAAGLADRVACVEGDFLQLPATLPPAHLAFSIEAFVHSSDPDAYFASTAARLVPGGLLIVCDDFLTGRTEGRLSRREARMLDEMRTGWVAASLVTVARADEGARRSGFQQVRSVDLTSFLDLRRPRDLLVATAVALGRHLPISGYRWRSLVGGSALQEALVSGLIEFRFLVWRRT